MNKFKYLRLVAALSLVALLLVFWAMPAIAWAQDTAAPVNDSSPAGEILLMVLKIVFSVLGLLATWLSMKGIKYVEKKTKIDLPASVELLVESWVEKGIGLAHEKSHQQVKKLGKKLGGSEKLNVALEFVQDRFAEHKLDAWAEEKLVKLVESKLGIKRQDVANELPTAVVVAE